MDIDYMDKFRIFTFDKKQFPDPKGLNGYEFMNFTQLEYFKKKAPVLMPRLGFSQRNEAGVDYASGIDSLNWTSK
jgi:hypothetical protein